MKAAQLITTVPSPQLQLAELPIPTPGPGELLIRVAASGVIPTELGWYPTHHTVDGKPRSLAIPGHEFSGSIAALGPGASGFSLGNEIYGMNDWFAEGAAAEYTLAQPSAIALKPRKLSLPEAASVPISALTAWQGLFIRANLQGGERILVHGASGAVGAYVVQLAKLHGAEVIATVTRRSVDFVRSLGADVLIDHEQTMFERHVHKVDVFFDCVGGETLARSWATLAPTGRAVTIVELGDDASDRDRSAFFIVEPSQEQLQNMAVLIDGGSIRPFVSSTVPLSQAADAYTAKLPATPRRGKVVLFPIP